ncbi:RIP metalloprotease RseP [Rossellomorea marisflavi]|uniref:Zinc metalloprotease n=1 Tax=Rossellomorea marisflavi TaxID=189381 RepID=A0A5D4RVH3_9BACI|nr:RIP metalloprotease RseP [Rossellomorea marisflavi]MDW4526524.1 RIP metalloprotease RseP [Rossellomorea marisflavi]TYS53848.1 RIP metalloprotease RseP [Rossellomorea marisflavi]WJV17092.1 RIP metalloprotease RseP [Rossellomorea marisflavi]
MQTVIAFIVIFGALVFFHELGHLIFAKRAGILCREFAIGFGPKVFSFKKNETVYTIRLLPLGGFVRMAGEDPEMVELKAGHRIGLLFDQDEKASKIVLNNKDRYPNIRVIEVETADLERELIIKGYEDDEEELKTFPISRNAVIVEDGTESLIAPWDRQFGSKSLPKRAMAIFAGPLFNFILAFFIFILVGFLQGVPTNDPVLGDLTDDGAAKGSGLQKGDEVLSIDDSEISTWEDIVGVIQKHPGDELVFTVERGGATQDISVTPEPQKVEGQEEIGKIGVHNPMEKSPLKVVSSSAEQTYEMGKLIFVLLGKLVTGEFSIDALSGPVGIYQSTDVVAQSGIYDLMRWAAILSINLGIMNLLPIPALDGGRLLFFAVEALRGKPVDRKMEGMVHFVGFALLMVLMLVVTWNDIQRFFIQN